MYILLLCKSSVNINRSIRHFCQPPPRVRIGLLLRRFPAKSPHLHLSGIWLLFLFIHTLIITNGAIKLTFENFGDSSYISKDVEKLFPFWWWSASYRRCGRRRRAWASAVGALGDCRRSRRWSAACSVSIGVSMYLFNLYWARNWVQIRPYVAAETVRLRPWEEPEWPRRPHEQLCHTKLYELKS